MSITKLIQAPDKRIKELERLVAQQEKVIERLRSSKVKPLRPSKRKRGKSAPFFRVFVGDSHGAYADDAAVRAFLSDMATLQPAEIVHVGDILEAGSFLAQHHILGSVAQAEYTFEDDVLSANAFLDGMYAAAPKAKITLIEGNHDARIEKACMTWSLQKKIDAAYLRKLFSPEVVLDLNKRGVRFIRRTDYVDGQSISGTAKFEFGLRAQHGETVGGPHASRQLAQRLGKSVVHGHNHQLDIVYIETADTVIVGAGTGCLCQRRPLWNLTKPTNWTHGYLLESVEPGVGFTLYPIPIIDGSSFLQPTLRAFNVRS